MGLAQYAFEIVMIIVLFVIGLLITIYATQAHSQCKKALNGNYGELSQDDIDKYTDAMHNLQQIIWIGWTIVSVAGAFLIIIIVVGVFFAPEIALTAESTMGDVFGPEMAGLISQYGTSAYETARNFGSKLAELNAEAKRAKNGLYFHAAFGGFISQLVFFVLFGTLFYLGIYAALASVKIDHTEGKHGYKKAQVAALLGIIPFSVFVVWFVADKIYVHMAESRVRQDKEDIQTEAMNARQELIDEGRYTPRRAAPPTPPQTPRRSAPPPPRQTPSPQKHAVPKQQSMSNNLASTGMTILQDPEVQRNLANAGQSLINSFLTK